MPRMSAGVDEHARFERAAEYMRSNSSLKLSNEQKLQLYGYYKQVYCDRTDPQYLSVHVHTYMYNGSTSWYFAGDGGSMLHNKAGIL